MSDPYWADVVFLSGFEGGSIVDESPLAQTVTTAGGTAGSSAQAKFGTKSLLHGGSSGRCSVPDHANFTMGSDPLTIDGWFYFTDISIEQTLVAQWQEATQTAFALRFVPDFFSPGNDAFTFHFAPTSTEAAFGDVTDVDVQLLCSGVHMGFTTGVWMYIAVAFDGTDWNIYSGNTGGASTVPPQYNGVGVGNPFGAGLNVSAPLSIGHHFDSGGSCVDQLQGYADEVRVTFGSCRYTLSDPNIPKPTAAWDRGAGTIYDETLTAGIGIDPFTGTGVEHDDTLTDDVGVSYRLLDLKRMTATASAGIGIDETALLAFYGQVVRERLRVQLTQITNHEAQLTITDDIGVDDLIRVGIPQAVAEGIGVAAAQQASHVIQIIEELGLLPVVAPAFKYGKSVTEAIRLSEQLLKAFGAAAADGIGVTQDQVATAARLASLSQGVGIAEAVNPQLLISVTAADTFEISHEDALNLIMQDALEDGIQLSAAYLSPASTGEASITTWAMNTRSGAVTEYTNYEFNSFARLGRKYLGATDHGLYEFIGDDDDGTDIVSSFKSGFAQWAGTKFTMFKAAYLAVRGGGDYVLKITTGDGKSYSYAVAARDMRTTKVNIGKGIRTRYFAFELISDGDDYDLESLEFVPIVTDRRV